MKKNLLVAPALALAMITTPTLAFASNDGVCSGNKIDFNGGKTVTVSAPAGQVITGYCVKAGSANQGLGPEYRDLDGVTSVTITHSSGKDISHYSVTYRPADHQTEPTPGPTVEPTKPPVETPPPTPEPTQPPVTPEPTTAPTTPPPVVTPTTPAPEVTPSLPVEPPVVLPTPVPSTPTPTVPPKTVPSPVVTPKPVVTKPAPVKTVPVPVKTYAPLPAETLTPEVDLDCADFEGDAPNAEEVVTYSLDRDGDGLVCETAEDVPTALSDEETFAYAGDEGLPFTGAPVGKIALGGLLLLAIGAALTFGLRSRV